MDENPYAAPTVELVDDAAPHSLQGWNASQLRVLGWLSLVSTFGTLVFLVMSLVGAALRMPDLETYGEWIGIAMVLLGNYLLIRFKGFAEARFEARGLGIPVWATVAVSLAMEGVVFGSGLEALDWRSITYLVLTGILGLLTLWFGIRLLKVQNVSPPFKVLAWLEIAAGPLLASVVLMMLAVIPALAAGVAMALVFFRGAEELEGLSEPR